VFRPPDVFLSALLQQQQQIFALQQTQVESSIRRAKPDDSPTDLQSLTAAVQQLVGKLDTKEMSLAELEKSLAGESRFVTCESSPARKLAMAHVVEDPFDQLSTLPRVLNSRTIENSATWKLEPPPPFRVVQVRGKNLEISKWPVFSISEELLRQESACQTSEAFLLSTLPDLAKTVIFPSHDRSNDVYPALVGNSLDKDLQSRQDWPEHCDLVEALETMKLTRERIPSEDPFASFRAERKEPVGGNSSGKHSPSWSSISFEPLEELELDLAEAERQFVQAKGEDEQATSGHVYPEFERALRNAEALDEGIRLEMQALLAKLVGRTDANLRY
jgi:hypothetical protein